MKKLFIVLTAALCVLSFAACKDSQPVAESVGDLPSEAPADSPQQKEEAEETPEAPSAEESVSANNEEMQVIGTEELGYLSVPADWVEFHDLAGGTDFQYSNLSGTSIVTMNTVSLKGLTEEQKSRLNAKAAAQSVWMSLEAKGVMDIVGAEVTLRDMDAYQVYGAYLGADESIGMIVCWLFETEDDVIHYLSAEAPLENIATVVGYVEDSFSVVKPQ